jgi:hypothetical protein
VLQQMVNRIWDMCSLAAGHEALQVQSLLLLVVVVGV